MVYIYVVHHLIIGLSGPPSPSGQDSGQFQFVVNALLGIVNIFAAALIPIWLFVVQNKRGMAYEITKDEITYLINQNVNPPSQTYQQAFLVKLKLWNSGRQSIVPEDIYGPIEFVFGPNAEIRDVHIIGKNPPTLGVIEPTIEGGATKISLAKPTTPFNKTYWVEIQLIMLTFHKVFEANSTIRDCEIKEIPQYLIKSRKTFFICTYIVALLFLLTTVFISFATQIVLNQPVDLIFVGLIWTWWFARKLDFSPRKLRTMARVCPQVLILLFFYAMIHFVTIYILVPNLLKIGI